MASVTNQNLSSIEASCTGVECMQHIALHCFLITGRVSRNHL